MRVRHLCSLIVIVHGLQTPLKFLEHIVLMLFPWPGPHTASLMEKADLSFLSQFKWYFLCQTSSEHMAPQPGKQSAPFLYTRQHVCIICVELTTLHCNFSLEIYSFFHSINLFSLGSLFYSSLYFLRALRGDGLQ